jgi:peptidoglycan/LPS O-acetylase OafA/YrhL
MRYNPALDGLRAVAIALVILLHCYPRAMPSGWVGVDVFFVLSGYLITSILLREINQTGGIDWIGFYRRRLLRLTPALAVLVVFQIIRAGVSPNGQEIREATLIGASYIENWNNVFHFGPFDVMGHTWSLATEEQFYLLWPLALLFLAPRHPLVWLVGALTAMTLARAAVWDLGFSSDVWNFSPEIRPVGLILGCILAVATVRAQPWPVVGPVLLAFVFAIGFFADVSIYTSLSAPLAVSLATAGLIVCLQYPCGVGRILSLPPLRYTGKISYGLYLYHWPIFILGEHWVVHSPFHLGAIGLLVLIYACAAASYELIERPALRLKDRLGARAPRPLAVAAE